MVKRGEQRGADVDIEGADILVAGGRGLGKAESFSLAEDLAKAFGGNAAVAATRAVVDAGWYPYAAQIGQTGKTVVAEAVPRGRHLRRDPAQGRDAVLGEHRRDQQGRGAPIFEFSDLGIVGDLNKILPKLTDAIKAKKASRWPPQRSAPTPAEFPPPVDSVKEFVKREIDAEDELIEVGVAIVGGGTAGLACANRLLQLLGDDPELLERLGEVPVAVVEKAKACGGHNLSGAVMRPGRCWSCSPRCPARTGARSASRSAR